MLCMGKGPDRFRPDGASRRCLATAPRPVARQRAVIGEVASDDAGKGAAIGATAGVMKGGAESRRKQAQAQQQAVATQEQQQQAAAQEQQAAREQELDFFRKSFGACLEAKDYTVK